MSLSICQFVFIFIRTCKLSAYLKTDPPLVPPDVVYVRAKTLHWNRPKSIGRLLNCSDILNISLDQRGCCSAYVRQQIPLESENK